MIVTGTKENFVKEVLDAEGLIIVDFWAEWCGPCKMISPTLELIATEREIKLVKINTDTESGLAEAYDIFSIPTIMFFRDRAVLKKIVGAVPKKTIEGIIVDLGT